MLARYAMMRKPMPSPLADVGGQPGAIVGHREGGGVAVLFEADVDEFGAAMLDGIGHGFLSDAIQMRAALGVVRAAPARGTQTHRQS